jgi:hypothetical protein
MTPIDNQATHIANSHVLSGGNSEGPSHPSIVLGSGVPMGVLRCTCCRLEALTSILGHDGAKSDEPARLLCCASLQAKKRSSKKLRHRHPKGSGLVRDNIPDSLQKMVTSDGMRT